MSDIIEIIHEGVIRKCGTIVPDERVPGTEFPLMAAARPDWVLTDAQITEIITDPSWELRRNTFSDDHWMTQSDQDGAGSCFPAGTLIRMSDGSHKKIEDVRCLDNVLTAEGRTRRVLKTMVRPHVGVIHRLCAWGNRHLRATAEHPILTREGYVPIEKLKKGQWVAIPRYCPEMIESIVPSEYATVNSKIGNKKALATIETTYECGIPGKPPSVVTRTPLPELIKLNAAFGRLCGLFLAEGSVGSFKITFTFHEDEIDTLAAEVVSIFKSEFGVKANICKHRGASRVCDVKVYGIEWCRLFCSLMGNGAAQKRLHPDLASGPMDFLKAVLRGWTDGDGLGPGKCGGISISHELAMNMYDVANKMGLAPVVGTFAGKIYPAREKVKSRQMRYTVEWAEDPDPHVHSQRMSLEENVMWRKVERIETEPFSGMVFNLEVEDDHSYVAEGIGVHNCQSWTCADIITILRREMGHNDGVVYSGDYIYSLLNGGVDHGSALIDGLKASYTNGTVPVSLCKPGTIWRKDTTQFDSEAAKHTTIQRATFELQNFQEMKSVVALRGVVNFAVMVDSGISKFANYTSGIVPAFNGIGNHSITGVDVEIVNGQLVFVAKNHWNVKWGMRGFGYFTEASVKQTIPVHGCWGSFAIQEAEA